MFDRTGNLEKAVRRYPRLPLFARLADHYLQRGWADRALALCEEGCERFPRYPTGHQVLGRCYAAQDRLEEARAALHQGLRLDPQSPEGFRQLSRIYGQMGNTTLALKSMEAAAQLDPFSDSLAAELEQLAGLGVVAIPAQAEAPPGAPGDMNAADTDESEQAQAAAPDGESEEIGAGEEAASAPAVALDEPFDAVQPMTDWEELAASPPVVEESIDPPEEARAGQLAELEEPMEPSPEPATDFGDLDDELAALGAEVADLGAEGGIPDVGTHPSGNGETSIGLEPESADAGMSAPQLEPTADDGLGALQPEPDADDGVAALQPEPTVDDGVAALQPEPDADDGVATLQPELTVDDGVAALQPEPAVDAQSPGAIGSEVLSEIEAAPLVAGIGDIGDTAMPELPAQTGPSVSRFGNGDNELVQLLHQIEDGDRVAASGDGDGPVAPVATTTLARLYADQGFPTRAIDTYRQVLDHDPDNEEVQAALAGLERTI